MHRVFPELSIRMRYPSQQVTHSSINRTIYRRIACECGLATENSRSKYMDHLCICIQVHVVAGTKRYAIGDRKCCAPVPETPLPKVEEAGSLGKNFGFMQMSKILHAAKYCFRPIRFAMIRRLVLAFCAVDWVLQLIPFCFNRRSRFGVRS